MITILEIVGLAIVGGIALLLGAALLYRGWRKLRLRRALRIRTPNKIEEGRFVPIGGRKQWILIRGENRDNPILLFVHGGPGIVFSSSAFTSTYRAWERDFTIVQWDQPGAGKTLRRNGRAGTRDLTIEGIAQDGIQVAEWVLRRLEARKLIIFGMSWGTILGTIMVKRRPDLFSAYVGVGQFVDGTDGEVVGYNLALARAERLGDGEALTALRTIGPPPYADLKTASVERRALGRLGPRQTETTTEPRRFPNILSSALFSPGYTLRDGVAFVRGIRSSIARFWKPMMDYDARQLGTTFEAPLFFFQGGLDLITPAQPVQVYVATLQAPHKELVVWENEGHMTFLTNPERILEELVARVRPVAVGGASN